MKMDTMNISLPPKMAEFVRRSVEGSYGNVSEYFRALVREKIEKQAAADLRFLRSTEGAGPGPSAKIIKRALKIQEQTRTERQGKRRGRHF